MSHEDAHGYKILRSATVSPFRGIVANDETLFHRELP